ncbi:hypothetical protein [Pyxidicoccus caerfyrddinensis]|uniref:hypothetical protein n=1 Tax=Pyxidicoccus caerfyrddinensis TaxID=2709663 RepID=UPI0013DA99F7|nr:hypothetical protein [Pyxidicoccus caerfyrddinensis]
MTQSPAAAALPSSDAGDSRALARSVGVNQFRLNPFRVLGVPVDVEASKALWRAEKLLTRARAGLPPAEASALPWLSGADELEVQQAAQKMEEPLRRLSEQLLWFDFGLDPRGEELKRALTGPDPVALAAYRSLRDEDLQALVPEVPDEGAADMKAVTERLVKLLAHRANQANLRLVLAFSAMYGLGPSSEDGGARAGGGPVLSWEQREGLRVVVDPHALFGADGKGAAWQAELTEALARWSALLQDSWFPTFLGYQITRLGDDLVSADDCEPLIAALRTRLADLVVGEMKQRLMGGFADEARALSRIASGSGLEPQVWTLAFRPLRSLFRAELAQLDTLVDESHPVHLNDVSLYLDRLDALNASWREIDSKQLLGLAVLIDEAVLRAFDRVRTLDFPLTGIGAVNAVLAEARRVANSESVKERIAAFRSRLEGRKDELCHYCRKREQDFEYAAMLSGRVETGRSHGFNSTTVHYRIRSLPILRCASCAKLHDYLASMGNWAVGAAAVTFALAVVLFAGSGGLLWGVLLAGLVGLGFRMLLGTVVTPRREHSYSDYSGSKAHQLLSEEGYGQLQYDYSLHAWKVAAGRQQ